MRIAVHDDRAALRIEDDGRGFDDATRARRREDGHLGLALVEDLASHLGGTAVVSSVPGRGTTVAIEVPA